MTKPKAKPPEENPWPARFRRMREHQRKHSGNWDRNRRLMFGGTTKKEVTPHNMVAYGWGLVKGLETTLYVQDPECLVEGLGEEARVRAPLLKRIVEHDWSVGNVKYYGNLGLQDCFVYGYGVLVECVATTKKEVELPNEETGEAETATGVTDQDFEWRRIHPKDILFDPAGLRLDLSDHRYIAMAYYPTIAEIKRDPRYKIPESVELKEFPAVTEMTRTLNDSSSAVFTTDSSNLAAEQDPEFKTICMWEIWDKVNHEIVYITDYNSHVFGTAAWPMKLKIRNRELFPATILAFHQTGDTFYPVPEIDLVARQLEEINEIDWIMSEDARTKWRKYAVLGGLLSDVQKAHIVDKKLSNSIIEIDRAEIDSIMGTGNMHQFDINRVITKLEDPSLERDLAARLEMLKGYISHVLGYGPSERGGLPSTRSAREAVMMNEAKNQKLHKRLDAIGDFYSLIGEKHIQVLQQTLQVERWVKIIPDAKYLAEWVKYGSEDIEGDFYFDVIPGTSGPKNTEVRKGQIMQMYQVIAPTLMQQGYDVQPLLLMMGEVMGWPEMDLVFKKPKQAAAQLAQALAGFNQGQVSAEQLIEAASAAIMAWMSEAEFRMLQKQMGQGQQQMSPGGPPPGMPPQPQGLRGDPNALETEGGMMPETEDAFA